MAAIEDAFYPLSDTTKSTKQGEVAMEMAIGTHGSLISLLFAGVAFGRADGRVGPVLPAPRVEPPEGAAARPCHPLHHPVHGRGRHTRW